MNTARKFYSSKQYQAAIDEFEKAYRAFPDPKIYLNLAQSHRLLRNDREALKYYRKFLDAVPSISEFSQEQKEFFSSEVQKKIQALEESLQPEAPPPVQPENPSNEPLTDPDPPPTFAPLTSRWWFWTGAGVTALFTVGAIWAGMKAMDYNDEWEENRVVRDHDQAVKFQDMTDLFLLGAVAAGVGVSVVSFMYHKKSSARVKGTTSRVSVLPGCGSHSCMLTLSWDF